MRQLLNYNKSLSGKLERERAFSETIWIKWRGEDNIKRDPSEMECVDWKQSAYDSMNWKDIVKTMTNLRSILPC
jgi:hypothetical protein